jgi:hypothetical protein
MSAIKESVSTFDKEHHITEGVKNVYSDSKAATSQAIETGSERAGDALSRAKTATSHAVQTGIDNAQEGFAAVQDKVKSVGK